MNSLDHAAQALNAYLLNPYNDFTGDCLVGTVDTPKLDTFPYLTQDQVYRLMSVHGACPVNLGCVSEVLNFEAGA